MTRGRGGRRHPRRQTTRGLGKRTAWFRFQWRGRALLDGVVTTWYYRGTLGPPTHQVTLPSSVPPMVRHSTALCALATLLLAGCGAPDAAPEAPAATAMEARVDSIAQEAVASGAVAGLSVGVLRGGDTLVLKGYGKADLELDVPTPPNALYEIASVTKQFTAAAILRLRDAGKLSLDDPITTHLPWYPATGAGITVARLLDHTSGIHSYTEVPAFGAMMARRLPRDSLLRLFVNAPLDFPTGTMAVYNNSAYFLAGLVIEAASGQSYADYVRTALFEPAGMARSRYCSEEEVQPGKVKGYATLPARPDSGRAAPVLRHKPFLTHAYPYAAGSLCATAGDLLAWNRALHTGRVLSAESYRALVTPSALVDGTALRYAKGLTLRRWGGHRLIAHGGGINGFSAFSSYFPDDSLAVVVLINSTGRSSDAMAKAIALAILGTREEAPVAFTGNLDALAGTYRGLESFSGAARGKTVDVVVSVDSGRLMVASPAAPTPKVATYLGDDRWALDEHQLRFTTGQRGAQLHLDRIYGYTILDKVAR